MSESLSVDAVTLRDEVKTKYRDVAVNPHGSYHFHTGRPLARRLPPKRSRPKVKSSAST
jgi:arsenite methyltransferase